MKSKETMLEETIEQYQTLNCALSSTIEAMSETIKRLEAECDRAMHTNSLLMDIAMAVDAYVTDAGVADDVADALSRAWEAGVL